MLPGLVTISVFLDIPQILHSSKDQLNIGYPGIEKVRVSSYDQRKHAWTPVECRAKGRISITSIESETAT